MNGSSQLGIGHILLSNRDELAVDFGMPIYSLDLALVGPVPKKRQPLLKFLRPLSSLVWILVLLTTLSCAITCALIISKTGPCSKNFAFGSAAFLVLGITCAQSKRKRMVSLEKSSSGLHSLSACTIL